MRKIGSLSSEAQARRFSAYLISVGVPAQTDAARDGTWEIWVHNDAQLGQASTELEQYLATPADPRYDTGVRTAAKLEKKAEAENRRSRARIIDARSQWGVFHSQALGPLTMGLMFICVAVYIYEAVSGQRIFSRVLSFTTPASMQAGDPLLAIKHGQVWRLFTPALLHGGPLHLLFNVIWLRQLGSMIEYHEGTLNFAIQVLVYGVVGNALQYFIGGNPFFLGMSGVVYGLFGFMWICAKHDPRRAYVLDKETVVLMIAWFALCFTGIIGPIANFAHAGGLLSGMLWASIVSRAIPFTRIRF
jgi:GlpG protein